MGRRRRRVLLDDTWGTNEQPRDRIAPDSVRTPRQLELFLDGSGVVSSTAWSRGLVEYDADMKPQINPDAVRKEAEALQQDLVITRQYPRDHLMEQNAEMAKERGLTLKRYLNAEQRTYEARVEAVRMAARVAGVQLSPAQKRAMTQIKSGFYDAVYGRNDEHSDGTLYKPQKWSGGKYHDSASKARAREKAEQLRAYRYGDVSQAYAY